jgi:two-component system sensor histidine kinase BaeS
MGERRPAADAVRGRWISPLTARLALAFVAVALAAVAMLAGLTLWSARGSVNALVTAQQADTADQVARAAADAYQQAGGWVGADLTGAATLAGAAPARLQVLDGAGRPVPVAAAGMGTGTGAGMGGMADRMRAMGAGELTPPVTRAVLVGGTPVGTVQLQFPAAANDATARLRDALVGTVTAGAGLAAVLAVAAATLVARRITRPVVALTRATRLLAAGDRRARVGAGAGSGELGELGRAFDGMADTLAREDEVRRAVVADLAHELRTPVTILQGSCEELVDGLAEPTPARLASLHEEVLRLGRLVEDLGALAAADAAGLRMERRRVDLGVVVADVAGSLRPRFDAAGVALHVDVAPVTVEGDPDRLHQVVANLLGNAAKFTPTGGSVRVRLTGSGGLARLTVADTGPGIAPDERERVFDRFWRGRTGRGVAGSGIGLAVVAELVRAHHGRVEVTEAAGGGAEFVVALPAAATPIPTPPTPTR